VRTKVGSELELIYGCFKWHRYRLWRAFSLNLADTDRRLVATNPASSNLARLLIIDLSHDRFILVPTARLPDLNIIDLSHDRFILVLTARSTDLNIIDLSHDRFILTLTSSVF
jgi:hypothetical protein